MTRSSETGKGHQSMWTLANQESNKYRRGRRLIELSFSLSLCPCIYWQKGAAPEKNCAKGREKEAGLWLATPNPVEAPKRRESVQIGEEKEQNDRS